MSEWSNETYNLMASREYHTNYTNERRRKRRKDAIQQLGGRCALCGSLDNLNFDHIVPATKIKAIGSMLNTPQDIFDAELAKCQLLCESCHKNKTKTNKEHGIPACLRGEDCGKSKLTEKEALEILNDKLLSQYKLAKKYNVSRRVLDTLKVFAVRLLYIIRKTIMYNKYTEQEFIDAVKNSVLKHIGAMYGVSDNSVRKWAKSYGIILKPRRGFWSKNATMLD